MRWWVHAAALGPLSSSVPTMWPQTASAPSSVAPAVGEPGAASGLCCWHFLILTAWLASWGRFATLLFWLKPYRRLVYCFCWFLVCTAGKLALSALEGEKWKQVASLFSPSSLICELSTGQTCYLQSAWTRLGELQKCEQS